MTTPTEWQSVAIIGPGRMGRGIELALHRAGVEVTLLSRSRRPEETRGAGLLLIATPDDAIAGLASELARERAVGAHQVVLHLSGLLDRRPLESLASTGAGLGSFHPLQTIADPSSAPERLAGSYAGLEGDERALAAGERLASALGMRAVRLTPGAKPAYHAGAVIASNYTVVLADMAERLAREAGIAAEEAAAMYLPLMRGSVANLVLGPIAALTGPIRRGDVATVRRHLAVLGKEDGVLYRALGLAALRLARDAGLPAEAAAEVERELREGS
ncbi:MAG TPA: Rossmann-like and DUF2520 domain-containing protein [Gemmatimonadales bacterium]|nr:Rossmann-like and DUF2520 domain-containing protein [Gemmatimonadales bacterium]